MTATPPAGDISRLPSGVPKHREISVVVPVYNSAATLTSLIARLEPVLCRVADRFEVLLVNDGSDDRSWSEVEHLAAGHDWIRGIDLMRNFGQHNALLCGIRAARFAVTVTLDDDLQHPPEEIPKLIERLRDGVDVVYGQPTEERHGFLRDLASRLTKLALATSMGVENARKVGPFRAFRTNLRDAFAHCAMPQVNIDVLMTWGTSRFDAVPVEHQTRDIGASNYTVRKLLQHAINMITGFSVLPLKLASIIGFALTLFGLLVLTWVVGRYTIQGGSVPGFPFLASIIAIFSGAQLFSLGIIGEYLARMHFRIMDRPSYVVLRATPEV